MLKTHATTHRTGRVGAISVEQYAHVHFVGLGFQPAEVTFDAIPRSRPFMFLVLAVIGFAIYNKILPLFGKVFERNIRRRAKRFAHAHQVTLAVSAYAA